MNTKGVFAMMNRTFERMDWLGDRGSGCWVTELGPCEWNSLIVLCNKKKCLVKFPQTNEIRYNENKTVFSLISYTHPCIQLFICKTIFFRYLKQEIYCLKSASQTQKYILSIQGIKHVSNYQGALWFSELYAGAKFAL